MIGEDQADAAKVVLNRAALPGFGGAIAAFYVVGAGPTCLGVEERIKEGVILLRFAKQDRLLSVTARGAPDRTPNGSRPFG
jgi:hypothetical protein